MGKNLEDLRTMQQILKDLVGQGEDINFDTIQKHPLFEKLNFKERFMHKEGRAAVHSVSAKTMINQNGEMLINIKGLKMDLPDHSLEKGFYESILQDFVQKLIKLKIGQNRILDNTSDLNIWFGDNFDKN